MAIFLYIHQYILPLVKVLVNEKKILKQTIFLFMHSNVTHN